MEGFGLHCNVFIIEVSHDDLDLDRLDKNEVERIDLLGKN